MVRGSAAFVVLACVARAAVLPAGTEMEVRLKTRVASNAAKTGDAAEAILIQPIVAGGEFVVPAGATLTGKVAEVASIQKPDQRAAVRLEFSSLSTGPGAPVKIRTRVMNVDNARESVDATGKIVGIVASETLAARMDSGVQKVSEKYARLGGFLDTIKTAMVKDPDPEVVYEPGVDLTLALMDAVEVPPGAAPAIAEAGPEAGATVLAISRPFRTTTPEGVPSDITNLMFLGSAEQLDAAFRAAGWASAAALNASSGLETVRAVAEMRGYKEAPVSVLLLEGKPPDMVFQKQNNTFAKRHHLRIWRLTGDFQGLPVWACAATHDIGIDFSPEKRTFIHRIDPEIDRERAKVVGDLLFGGQVAGLSLVARPAVPARSHNATGDELATDGRIAILRLK